jgi:prolyl-tRNA editing enzyme YbaK/EbsC (Cys-tRNA(Pro) deacylase)
MDGATENDEIETLVRGVLDGLGIGYEALPCDPELADTAAFCEHYGVAPEDSANAIVVAGKAEPRVYACCVVLATTRLDVNGAVRRRLGTRKASFASADETRELTGMLIGGVTPIGLPPDVPIWVDRQVMGRNEIILGGGSRSLKIRVAPTVFAQLPNTEVVDDLAIPMSASA